MVQCLVTLKAKPKTLLIEIKRVRSCEMLLTKCTWWIIHQGRMGPPLRAQILPRQHERSRQTSSNNLRGEFSSCQCRSSLKGGLRLSFSLKTNFQEERGTKTSWLQHAENDGHAASSVSAISPLVLDWLKVEQKQKEAEQVLSWAASWIQAKDPGKAGVHRGQPHIRSLDLRHQNCSSSVPRITVTLQLWRN